MSSYQDEVSMNVHECDANSLECDPVCEKSIYGQCGTDRQDREGVQKGVKA
jgi:hypothetical protein